MHTPLHPLLHRFAERLLAQVVVAMALWACAINMSPSLADPDLWGHVQYGLDAWREGLHVTTTYSYLAEKTAWINHEILAELSLAAVAVLGGGPALLIAKFLAAIALVTHLYWHGRRRGVGPIAALVLIALVAASLGRFWSLRPQLFSFLAYTTLLTLLHYVFTGWQDNWQLSVGTGVKSHGTTTGIRYHSPRLRLLWLVPLLMALWTNTHGGFLAGLAIYVAYLGGRGLEVLSQRTWLAVGLIKRFALMSAAAIIATLLNPYGPRFHLWLWHDVSVPRPEIVEWLPVDFTQPHAWPFLALSVATIIALAGSRRAHDFTHLVVLACTWQQALTHERHIPFFALSAAFFLPLHWQDTWQRCTKRFTISTSMVATRFQLGVTCAAVVLSGIFLLHQTFQRLKMLEVPKSDYPISAIQFMADHQLTGRMVCNFNWAQYLLYAFGRDEQPLRVHVDGRCRTAFTQEMLDAHFDFLYGPPDAARRYRGNSAYDPLSALTEKYPNLVLLDRRLPFATQTMEKCSRDWVLLYQDQLSQLWGRRTWYDDPRSSAFLPTSQRSLSDQPQFGSVPWPALPHR